MNKNKLLIIQFCLLLIGFVSWSTPSLFALTADKAATNKAIEGLFAEGVVVDLRNPEYTEGVLTCTEGGVITAPSIRIQALKIIYTKQPNDGQPIHTVIAEDQIYIEYGNYVFIGSYLEYDFETQTGVLWDGRSGVDPWYFGGERVHFRVDGDLDIENAYLTTSNDLNPEWQVKIASIYVTQDRYLTAKNVQFQFSKIPIFWLPTFVTKLDWIFDSPIRYRLRWGGKQGVRLGMIYEAISTDTFKAFIRFDYRLDRGPAFGLQTNYTSLDKKESFFTINYVARDNALEEPHERFRYRFQGIYSNLLDDDKLAIDFSYDKVSDWEMPTDYYDKGLDLYTAGRTQLDIRRQQDEFWIANFHSRVRINNFQTVKQELPSASTSMHPIMIGDSGMILENQVKGGYLDFKYANDQDNVKNYHSSRYEVRHKLYRPFYLGPFTLTPEGRAIGIYYGNSPGGDPEWVATATMGGELNTQMYKYYSWGKHLIEPYTNYQYIIRPTEPPDDHYIFDIQDGWYSLSALRWGVRSLFYKNCSSGDSPRLLTADLFTYAFLDNQTQKKSIPRLYAQVIWNTLPTMRNHINVAWDFERNDFDHINIRNDWTISDCLAVAVEYRHRNAWSWRKSVPYNFILESFRPEEELRHSQLSDKRDTLLTQFYYRFAKNWVAEFKLRKGWNRTSEPGYIEYQCDLTTTLRSSWQLRLSYQWKEDDHRLAMYVALDVNRPKANYCCRPCY